MIHFKNKTRRGAASILICFLMVPLLFLLAFSVDYGYLLFIRTNMQKAADQAALAAARDLMPNQWGEQDLDKVRTTVRNYIELNLGQGFNVLEADITIGRYDPSTIYGDLSILDSGVFDTVQVTIRRSDSGNPSVAMYFAQLFGRSNSGVNASSTAILQRAKFLGPGTSVFPFALQSNSWNRIDQGETVSIYGDGRIEDESGKNIPGNWGTIDIGPKSNSTADLSQQIRNGLSQSDLNSLEQQGAISSSEYIDATSTIELNGDTGLSAGLKHALEDVEGTMKVAPIYQTATGKGGNLNFKIVGWVTVEVVDSNLAGSKNSYVNVRKSYTYDANLMPVTDLSDLSESIEGAFTSPVLVQ